MISKSMFTQQSYYEFREYINPVTNRGVPLHPYYSDVPFMDCSQVIVIPDTSNALAVITGEDLDTLKYIELNYGKNMANKTYEAMPNDYNKYIQLYSLIHGISQNTTNEKILTLLKITEEALQGAVNSYAIYGDNLALKLSTLNLQNQVNTILSNKNENVVATGSGQLSVTKTFKLAPVFNYYIVLYGMPLTGVGFNPLKIKFLEGLLTRIGINPYK